MVDNYHYAVFLCPPPGVLPITSGMHTWLFWCRRHTPQWLQHGMAVASTVPVNMDWDQYNDIALQPGDDMT